MINMKNIVDITDDELLEMDMYEKGQIIMVSKRNDKEIHSAEKPYVVISNLHLNLEEDGVLAVPISREETKVRPLYHIKVKSNTTEGYIICENSIKVPKICISRVIGKISDSEMKNLNGALAAIYENHDTNKHLKAYEDASKKMKKLCDIEERNAEKNKNKEIKEAVESEIKTVSEKLKLSEEKVAELTEENKKNKEVIQNFNKIIEEKNEELKTYESEYDSLAKSNISLIEGHKNEINEKDKLIAELNNKIQVLEKVGNTVSEDTKKKIMLLETENAKLKEDLKNNNNEDDFEKEVLREKQKLYEETNKKYEDDLFKSQVIIKRLQKILMAYEPDNKYVKMDV